MRSIGILAISALAFGLIFPKSAYSADLAVEQRTSASPTPVAGSDDSLAYLLTPFRLASQPNLKQSVFGFVGRTNSGNLGSTFIYGLNAPQIMFYDNYIVGGAYQRDLFQFNSGLIVGAEVGLADRFGHYGVCCDTIVYSSGMVNSAELWGGASFRTQGFAMFDTVRISPGFVFGLSSHLKSDWPGRRASNRPPGERQDAFLSGLRPCVRFDQIAGY